MHPIRQIIDDAPDFILAPEARRHCRIEAPFQGRSKCPPSQLRRPS